MGNQPSEHLRNKLQKDQILLETIKVHLPELESLLFQFQSDYEDRLYRFYYQSFKVYFLEESTLKAADLFRRIGAVNGSSLCDWFEEIVAQGTGSKFEPNHDESWRFIQDQLLRHFFTRNTSLK